MTIAVYVFGHTWVYKSGFRDVILLSRHCAKR